MTAAGVSISSYPTRLHRFWSRTNWPLRLSPNCALCIGIQMNNNRCLVLFGMVLLIAVSMTGSPEVLEDSIQSSANFGCIDYWA